MLKRIFGMRVVECLQCHRISLPGASECPHCKASLARNSVVRRIKLQNPDDMVHASVSCPGCGRLLKMGTETCPECGTYIWREYAARSVKANVTVAQAYNSAQRIEGFKPGFWLMLAFSAGTHVYLYAFGLMTFRWLLLVPLAISTLSLLEIMRWFRRFGGFESDDENFATARHKVKSALRLLLFIIAAQVIDLIVVWSLW